MVLVRLKPAKGFHELRCFDILIGVVVSCGHQRDLLSVFFSRHGSLVTS